MDVDGVVGEDLTEDRLAGAMAGASRRSMPGSSGGGFRPAAARTVGTRSRESTGWSDTCGRTFPGHRTMIGDLPAVAAAAGQRAEHHLHQLRGHAQLRLHRSPRLAPPPPAPGDLHGRGVRGARPAAARGAQGETESQTQSQTPPARGRVDRGLRLSERLRSRSRGRARRRGASPSGRRGSSGGRGPAARRSGACAAAPKNHHATTSHSSHPATTPVAMKTTAATTATATGTAISAATGTSARLASGRRLRRRPGRSATTASSSW